MSKHLPEVQRVTEAVYRCEDKLDSLQAIERRGAWGSPDPYACRPVRREPNRLPLPEVTRRQAELALALQRAATVLEDALEHQEDSPAQQDLAIAAAAE